MCVAQRSTACSWSLALHLLHSMSSASCLLAGRQPLGSRLAGWPHSPALRCTRQPTAAGDGTCGREAACTPAPHVPQHSRHKVRQRRGHVSLLLSISCAAIGRLPCVLADGMHRHVAPGRPSGCCTRTRSVQQVGHGVSPSDLSRLCHISKLRLAAVLDVHAYMPQVCGCAHPVRVHTAAPGSSCGGAGGGGSIGAGRGHTDRAQPA